MATATKKTATKTATKNVAPVANTAVTYVALAKSTYHYWRNKWVTSILDEAGVTGYRFDKEKGTYNGTIMVDSKQLVKANNALNAWKKKPENKDLKDLWWK